MQQQKDAPDFLLHRLNVVGLRESSVFRIRILILNYYFNPQIGELLRKQRELKFFQFNHYDEILSPIGYAPEPRWRKIVKSPSWFNNSKEFVNAHEEQSIQNYSCGNFQRLAPMILKKCKVDNAKDLSQVDDQITNQTGLRAVALGITASNKRI